MKRLSLLCLSLLETITALAQTGEMLVADSAIITGKLDNGITYYLRHNAYPRGRASFYLVRNAGSVLEEDKQDGLAHFLEHMAFKGTKHFPGGSLIEALERGGVAFASGVNAYTGQDETVYNISGAPTADENFIDTCLLILHDWSYHLTLSPSAIDEERKVIAEEWRRKQTPDFRIHKQTLPFTFKGSRYAERDVIGEIDVIQNFKPAELMDFYRKWYRTDLEAIIIVGDLDMAKMEEKVKTLFSTIPAVKQPQPLPAMEVPFSKGTDYVLATDPEAGRSSLGLAIRHKDTVRTNTTDYIRENLLLTLCNTMIQRRLKERQMNNADPAVLRMSIANMPLIRGYSVYNLSVTPKDDEAEAWRVLLTENERLARHGFTEAELTRVKKDIAENLENTLLHQGGVVDNEVFVRDIQAWFLTGKPAITFRTYYDHAKRILEALTLADANAKLKDWNKPDNRIIVIAGKTSATHLSEERALKIEEEVRADQSITPYVETKSVKRPLLAQKPQGGKIVSERELPTFKAKEWTLSNGAKVVFRRAAYERGTIQVSSFSPGGTSLYDIDLLPAAENAAPMTKSFGLADHTPVELGKILADKHVRTNVSISECSESISGAAAPKDLETLFQLLYLHFEQPRFDARLFEETMSRSRSSLANQSVNPNRMMNDSLQQISCGRNPRMLPYDTNYLDAITLERIENIYRDRFSNAADFTFFIVGDIAESKVKRLSEIYLGALSTKHTKEQCVDHKMHLPKGHTGRTITLPMQNPMATVVNAVSKPLAYTAKHNAYGSILQALLTNRFTNRLRHTAGGTYDVNVTVTSMSIPSPRYTMQAVFNCDPARAEELRNLLEDEARRFLKSGPTEEELASITKAMLGNAALARPHNAWWMNAIASFYMDGIDMTAPANFEDIISRAKPSDIRKFAKKLWKDAATMSLIFVPEETAAASR